MSGTTLNKAYCYDAFGVEKDIDKNDKNPFRYCGEYYDNEIDKIYLRARYYSPIQGRFTTEDPIKDGLNWYAYCAGDPVNAWDPSGLLSDPIIKNGVVLNYRLPLRDIVTTLGGTIKVNDDSVTVDALGKNINIMYSEYANDEHNVNNRLYFTPEEVLDLLGVEYDMEQVSLNISKSDNNKKTMSYVAKQVINGQLIGSVTDVINSGIDACLDVFPNILAMKGVEIGFDIKDAIEDSSGKSAKVLPPGDYTKKVYKVKTPKTGEKSGIISFTFSQTNDYIMLKPEHWSVEFNSTKMGNGYEYPGYINIYSH